MEERLIEAIKLQPCLFDKSSHLFRNKYLKERAWQTVAASIGVSEENCKSRWKSLRDRFVREAAQNKGKSGAAADDKVEWCYMESMHFLTKHIAPRKTVSNFQWHDDQPSCSNSPLTPQSDNAEILEEYGEAQLNDSQSSADTPVGKKTQKRKRMEEESHRNFERLCGSIEAVIANKREDHSSKNYAFLQMLDECLQKKPEDVQEKLKLKFLHMYILRTKTSNCVPD